MAQSRSVWRPQISNNSIGFPVGFQLKLVQVSKQKGKVDTMVVDDPGKKNLFCALFDEDDTDFEIEIDNDSKWDVKFGIKIGNERVSYISEKRCVGSMKALVSNGKHLHFLSQKTDDGKLLVAMNARLNGTTYEEAAVSCSRIEFDFIVGRSPLEDPILEYRMHLKGPTMPIYVKILTGEIIPIQVYRQDTIAGVKCLIHDEEGTPPDQQRLRCDGKQLQNGRTLSYYRIRRDSTIHMVKRMSGGYMPSPVTSIEEDSDDAVGERGVVCFGQQTNQHFRVYNGTFIKSDRYFLEGFIVELRTKPKYSVHF